MCTAGRLSKDEIERMVQDAEKYKNDDENQRDRIQAKNALESYAYNMKSTAEDDKLKEKLSEADRKKITDKCNEVISWLDNNQVSRLFLSDVVSVQPNYSGFQIVLTTCLNLVVIKWQLS